jgi:hypothetical protein
MAVMPARAANNMLGDLVRFTLDNDTSQFAAVRLESSSAFYYLSTQAGETKVFTPERGMYNYTFYSCGTSVSGTIDLTRQQVLHAPPCGSKTPGTGYNPGFIDGGDLLKLVRIELENDTTGSALIIMEGPATFVFTIAKGVTKNYTVPKGIYSYTMYGCGTVLKGTFYAEQQDKQKTFTCP